MEDNLRIDNLTISNEADINDNLDEKEVPVKNDYCTIDEMKEIHNQKITLVKEVAKFRCNQNIEFDFHSFTDMTRNIRKKLGDLKTQIHTGEKTLYDMEHTLVNAKRINQRLSHMNDNLPEVFRKKAAAYEESVKATIKPKKQEEKSDQKLAKSVPTVPYVTLKEFESVPKYMRGRYKYDQINKLVDDYNTALNGKYRFMSQPRKTMKADVLKTYNKLKAQESAETKGLYFCTPDDLKDYGRVKVDQTVRNIFTILRHCGKVKEIRGPATLIRYAVHA